MLRILFFMSISLLISIPHTSIQDNEILQRQSIENQFEELIQNDNKKLKPIENLLQLLSEQQHIYETAYYGLTLKNLFPKFAKYFHEQSESKYNDVKNLVRLCQILNFNINLPSISSHRIHQPLNYLSPDRINSKNFVQFINNTRKEECIETLNKISDVYDGYKNSIINVPLQMYLKENFYPKQIEICKLTNDLFVQIDRFIDIESNDYSIPFSLFFFDSQIESIIEK